MKAPLRFAFGWVVYVAILCAVSPALRAVLDFFDGAPLDLAISLVAALVAFISLWWFVLRAFWRWCDAPRKAPEKAL
ncbi:hypothetical protein [Pseudomonas knackmussii]|uniref:hypothetical protein n=1 Tax=Pseudomonas knackmussii TaxID=65741 RepID=UPI003F4A6825